MEKLNRKITTMKVILLLISLSFFSNPIFANKDLQIIEMKKFNLQQLLPLINKNYTPVAASIKDNGWIFFLQQSLAKKKKITIKKNPLFVKWFTLPLKNVSSSIDYYIKKGYVPFGLFEKNRLEIGVAFSKVNNLSSNNKLIQCSITNFLFDLHSNYMRTLLVKKMQKVIKRKRIVLGISVLFESMYVLDCSVKEKGKKIKHTSLPLPLPSFHSKKFTKWFLGYYSDIRKMHRDLKKRKKENWIISGFHYSEKMNYVLFVK